MKACPDCVANLRDKGWLCVHHAGGAPFGSQPEAAKAARQALRQGTSLHLCMGDVRKALGQKERTMPRDCPRCIVMGVAEARSS